MAGAETLLPLTLNLVRDEVIDMTRAFDLLATRPAKLLGVDAGRLAVGFQADIAIVDPDRPWIVDSDKMAAAAGNTPFDKQPVQGRVLALFKGGAQVWAKKTAPS
jgi:dihydroorotase